MEPFDIYVTDGRGTRYRTTIEAASPNAALKAYGIKGTRPYRGQATSKSGKRFEAVPMVTP